VSNKSVASNIDNSLSYVHLLYDLLLTITSNEYECTSNPFTATTISYSVYLWYGNCFMEEKGILFCYLEHSLILRFYC